MKKTTKFLFAILGLGIVYTLYQTMTGHGGSGLYDGIDAITNTSIVLFVVSFIIIIYNIRNIKSQGASFIFLLLALPLTISAISDLIQQINYNRPPDLTNNYPRPFTQKDFVTDSLNIQKAVEAWVVLNNMNSKKNKISNAYIDTIIYSENGDKIFVPFYMEYENNNHGYRFYTSAFYAGKKDSIYWNLEEAKYRLSADYYDSIVLKKEVRKFYFNQFKFANKDSLNDNYFWNKMSQNITTIVVN